MVKVKMDQHFPSVDKVEYTNTSTATTAGTPVWVAAFGAMVPITDALISMSNMYWTKGRFDCVIVNGVTIANGNTVYFISASGCVTNVDPGGSGFVFGQAITAGSAAGTATAYTDGGGWVTVDLNSALSAVSGAFNGTTVVASGNATVGGTLTVTGAATLSSTVAVTGAQTNASTLVATKITATAGQVAQLRTASTLNTTGIISAANLVNGIITSTSAAAVTATLPAASAVLALLPGAVVGTSISFLIANSAGANTVTVTASASITNALAQAGDMAVASGSNVSYMLVFTNVSSGTEAAVIYRW